jgi:predicted transcriptional regulator
MTPGFVKKVKTGLAQLDNEEFVTHEEIGTRIDQMFST